MMKIAKTAMLSSALVGALVLAAPAFAQTAPSGTYRGLVDVTKGLNLLCTLELEVNSSNNTATVTYFGPPVNSPECQTIAFVNQPYSYTFNPSSGTLVLSGVHVNTITAGDCAGSIAANWTPDEILVDSFLPPATAGAACTIAGVLDFQP